VTADGGNKKGRAEARPFGFAREPSLTGRAHPARPEAAEEEAAAEAEPGKCSSLE